MLPIVDLGFWTVRLEHLSTLIPISLSCFTNPTDGTKVIDRNISFVDFLLFCINDISYIKGVIVQKYADNKFVEYFKVKM